MSQSNSVFQSYIHAVGDVKIPNGMSIFGMTGGHQKWTTINIPPEILNLPLDEQLKLVPDLMNRYLVEFGGKVPFFGAVTGFVFAREFDHYQFDRDGKLLGHVDEAFSRGAFSVSIR